MSLKDRILKNLSEFKNEKGEKMGISLRGYVEIDAYKNGVKIYHDEGANHVTYWARHAIMQALRGSVKSRFGSQLSAITNLDKAISKRTLSLRTSTLNPDGTCVSGEQYFTSVQNDPTSVNGDGVTPILSQGYDFYGTGAAGASASVFDLMPTKVLFGTGVEFEYVDLTSPSSKSTKTRSIFHRILISGSASRTAWLAGNSGSLAEITSISDIDLGAANAILSQFGFTATNDLTTLKTNLVTFNNHFTTGNTAITTPAVGKTPVEITKYSSIYRKIDDTLSGELVTTRTANDILSNVLPETYAPTDPIELGADTYTLDPTTNLYYAPAPNNQSFAVAGAIKTCKFDASYAINNANKGFGVPAFVYLKKDDKALAGGDTPTLLNKSNDKETKIQFTVSLPQQSSSSDFYPYNGYLLKQIGLYNDAFFAKKQPSGKYFPNSADTFLGGFATESEAEGPSTFTDRSNHAVKKFGYGTLFAIRNIKPILKDWDVSIEVKWTLYFDESI